MSQLTASIQREFETPCPASELLVADNVKIFRGSAVGFVSGYARQLVSGDQFAGFAETSADNTLLGHAAGAKSITIRRFGFIRLPVASVAITDVGSDVFASDGNTYALAVGTFIGKVHRFISTGFAIVAFDLSNP